MSARAFCSQIEKNRKKRYMNKHRAHTQTHTHAPEKLMQINVYLKMYANVCRFSPLVFLKKKKPQKNKTLPNTVDSSILFEIHKAFISLARHRISNLSL